MTENMTKKIKIYGVQLRKRARKIRISLMYAADAFKITSIDVADCIVNGELTDVPERP